MKTTSLGIDANIRYAQGKMNQNDLVAKAKENLPKTQVTFPYGRTRKAGQDALEKAQKAGEPIFPVFYRHYYGTAVHYKLYAGSAAFKNVSDKTVTLKAIAAEVTKLKTHQWSAVPKMDYWSRCFRIRGFHAQVRDLVRSKVKTQLSNRAFAYVCAVYEFEHGVKKEQVSYHAYEHLAGNDGKPSKHALAALRELGLRPTLPANASINSLNSVTFHE